jgi:ABC-2 type transport system permease protein
VQIAGSWAALIVMLSVGALAFVGIGFIIASVAKNAKVAPIMANVVFFPLMFLGGAAFPLAFLPPAIRKVARVLPSSYLVDGLGQIIVGGAGLGANLTNLAVLAITFVVALAIASKLFRWE